MCFWIWTRACIVHGHVYVRFIWRVQHLWPSSRSSGFSPRGSFESSVTRLTARALDKWLRGSLGRWKWTKNRALSARFTLDSVRACTPYTGTHESVLDGFCFWKSREKCIMVILIALIWEGGVFNFRKLFSGLFILLYARTKISGLVTVSMVSATIFFGFTGSAIRIRRWN